MHTRPPSSPPPGAPRKNEALARAESAWLEASLSCQQQPCSPRATSRRPQFPGRHGHLLSSLEPSCPQRHIPGDSRTVTQPTRRAAARGSKGGKGAAEGGAAAGFQSSRPEHKAPGPRHLFPSGPRGWGNLLLAIPLLPQPSLPCLGLPCCLGRCPGKPRRAAAAKAKAGCGAREERRVARGHSPGRPGAARVLPGRCRRPTVGASARDELGGGGSARRLRGGADPARPPGVGSAWLSRSGSGAAPRLLAAFRAEGCRQAANGDPAGGLATRPTHLRAARPGRRCSCCAALAAPPRSALWARWRALPRTPPHQPTHPTPAQRAVARNVGAPPVTSGYAALFR